MVAEATSGHGWAWDELVERYSGLVYSVTAKHRLSSHDARDVSQATWLKLTQHLDRLRDPDRVGLWLHTTARNECLEVIRRSGRTVPVAPDPLEPTESPAKTPEELLDEAESGRLLRAALERISDGCQKLISLMLLADPPASYTEISEACGIAVGTIGPRRKRCLERLRGVCLDIAPELSPELEVA